MIFENIMKNKTVSVWGLGYLGYTTIFKLQTSGFKVKVYDLNAGQLKAFTGGRYPDNNQKATWSLNGFLPKLDYPAIQVAKSAEEMFKDSCLHIIAMPESRKNTGKDTIASRMAVIFARNIKKSGTVPLVIFESAFIPGNIQKNFIDKLRKERITVSKDYHVGVFFRADWSVEAFIGKKDKMPVAGCCPKGSEAIRRLLEHLGLPVIMLDSIKDAEIYANSMNVIQAMAIDFLRQLAMGYPFVNMKKMSKALFGNISLADCELNIGTGGERMTFSTDYLIEGSDKPGNLTLLKEFQDIGISSVLSYADYIIRHGYKSVEILGITYKGNQKDLTLSPSVTLADYLIKNGLKVSICDPYCTVDEIRRYIKGVTVRSFPSKVFSSDVVVVASDHNQYKCIAPQKVRDAKNKVKLIIDNYGIWEHLRFEDPIRYHQVGDGSLDLSK
ncbi:MAG: UDP binding domain-containing protein [Candidatus Omnitrophota bacterium]